MKKPLHFLLFSLLLLTLQACTTIPTSPRADEVRAQTMPQIERELAARKFSPDAKLYLVAFKHEGRLEAWLQNPATKKYDLFKSYPICSFSGDLGPKFREGDKQTPEGFYNVTARHLNPRSQFHLSFNIGYPNELDRQLGRTGSYVMVHGGCKSLGCLAMGDEQIEEIYMLTERAFRKGQKDVPIAVYPFAMTDENMARFASDSPHRNYWEYLKTGHDSFELQKTPQPEQIPLQDMLLSKLQSILQVPKRS
jgi:murein L,D-transpeptidase YafK